MTPCHHFIHASLWKNIIHKKCINSSVWLCEWWLNKSHFKEFSIVFPDGGIVFPDGGRDNCQWSTLGSFEKKSWDSRSYVLNLIRFIFHFNWFYPVPLTDSFIDHLIDMVRDHKHRRRDHKNFYSIISTRITRCSITRAKSTTKTISIPIWHSLLPWTHKSRRSIILWIEFIKKLFLQNLKESLKLSTNHIYGYASLSRAALRG